MNAIALKPIIQEGIELEPGYCPDPLSPLWESGIVPNEGIALHLYQTARNIDEWGNGNDWIKSLLYDVDSIKKDLFAWYSLALRAWKIKLFKSYRLHCGTFQEFCEKFLGCSVGAINQKIRAARVVSQLISLGFERLPKSPSVCNELLALEWESLGDIWRDITDKFQEHEITAEKVKNMIEDPLDKKPQLKQIRIPAQYYEKAKEQAAIAGMPFNAFIDSLFEDYLGEKADDGLRTTGENSSPCKREWLCSDPEESNARDSSSDLPYATSGPILSDNPNEKREGITNGNPSTDSQEPQPQGPVDLAAIANIEKIAYAVKREIKTSFHKPERRNFMKDSPWGALSSEIGEDPKIVFEAFKKYLIEIATAKPYPNPEAWAGSVANSLFNNEGSEFNCIPWVKFSESYKSGQPVELPQQTQIDPMEEWFEMVKELRMFPQICRRRNAVKDCNDWVPYEQISKRYTLEYLRKQVKKS